MHRQCKEFICYTVSINQSLQSDQKSMLSDDLDNNVYRIGYQRYSLNPTTHPYQCHMSTYKALCVESPHHLIQSIEHRIDLAKKNLDIFLDEIFFFSKYFYLG